MIVPVTEVPDTQISFQSIKALPKNPLLKTRKEISQKVTGQKKQSAKHIYMIHKDKLGLSCFLVLALNRNKKKKLLL